LARALAEKERVANRTEEDAENEKAARAVQAAQRKKDSDRKLVVEEDNFSERKGRLWQGANAKRIIILLLPTMGSGTSNAAIN
jgi:hypothetical protein